MLNILRAAVAARLACWDAAGELETALGFPGGDVPDGVDEILYDTIGLLAAGLPFDRGVEAVTQEHLDDLLREVAEASDE